MCVACDAEILGTDLFILRLFVTPKKHAEDTREKELTHSSFFTTDSGKKKLTEIQLKLWEISSRA